jgi:hypothetical protein
MPNSKKTEAKSGKKTPNSMLQRWSKNPMDDKKHFSPTDEVKR